MQPPFFSPCTHQALNCLEYQQSVSNSNHITYVHRPNLVQVGGNAELENTFKNASKCLYAFGAPDDLLVHRGAAKPLVRASKQDAEIHGNDGLGGVEGLPDVDHAAIRSRLDRSLKLRAIEGISAAVRSAIQNAEKVTIVSTGPMTNIALFVSIYPDLLDGVEEFVFMGGAVGMGNRSSVAGESHPLCITLFGR